GHGPFRSRASSALRRTRGPGGRGLPAVRRVPRVLLPLHRRCVPRARGARPELEAPHDSVLPRTAHARAPAGVRKAAQPCDADGRLPETVMNPVIAEPRFRTFYADEIAGRAPRPARAYALACIAGLLMTAGAGCLLLVGAASGFRARRLYAVVTARIARVVLRLYGIRLEVHGHLAAGRRVVYISNHTSTLDLFVLVALDLPRTRFFLSGFLRPVLPLGAIAWLLGTFFTVPQTRPAERRRIFARADRILRRTRESVYLSP